MYTTIPVLLLSKLFYLIYPLIIGYCLDVIGFCVIFYLEQRGFIMEIKFTGAGKLTGAGKFIGEIRRITIPKDMVFRGNLDLSDMELTELPDLSAVTVTGDFNCSYNGLTTLNGAPKSVGGNFDCSWNPLTSLVGAPQTVGGYFGCVWCRLTTLAGAPKNIGKHFICFANQLTSLAEGPQTVGGGF